MFFVIKKFLKINAAFRKKLFLLIRLQVTQFVTLDFMMLIKLTVYST